MKIRVPDYFPEFKCIADRCDDSCCIGWEIDIDDKTLDKYANLGGKIGAEIRKKTQHGYFPLKKNGKCVFLDDNGLCRIISALGDGYLCDICREHPRYYGIGKCGLEGGLGLACPEAARIILSHKDRPEFTVTEASPAFISEDKFKDKCDDIRELIYSVIYSTPPQKLCNAILNLAIYADNVAFSLLSGTEMPLLNTTESECDLSLLLAEAYKTFNECEALCSEWKQILKRAEEEIDPNKLNKSITENETEFRNLLFYFTHRYQRESVEDMTMGSKVLLALASSLIILATAEISHSIQRAAVLFSKNIEYSTDNIDLIIDNLSTFL